MPITPKFTEDQVKRHLDDFLNVVVIRQIKSLRALGEMCVKHANDSGAYTDQTGNLRNSIGYLLIVEGEVVYDSFDEASPNSEKVANTKEGKKKGGMSVESQIGPQNGKILAESLAKLHTEGIVLIVVAGMNYALYVEAKGYNVLTATERFAEVEARKMIRDLMENIKKA